MWQQPIQHAVNSKTVNASLARSGNEASLGSTMNINSRSKQSALRVYFDDSFSWSLQNGKHCPYDLICQNIAILFQGVEIGFKRISILKELDSQRFLGIHKRFGT